MTAILRGIDKRLSVIRNVQVEIEIKSVGFVLFNKPRVDAGFEIYFVEPILFSFVIQSDDDDRGAILDGPKLRAVAPSGDAMKLCKRSAPSVAVVTTAGAEAKLVT